MDKTIHNDTNKIVIKEETEICDHDWIKNKTNYVCSLCGNISNKKPNNYTSDSKEENTEEIHTVEKCIHVWECLKDRCHNKGKGKYRAYRCKLCDKFQRR